MEERVSVLCRTNAPVCDFGLGVGEGGGSILETGVSFSVARRRQRRGHSTLSVVWLHFSTGFLLYSMYIS